MQEPEIWAVPSVMLPVPKYYPPTIEFKFHCLPVAYDLKEDAIGQALCGFALDVGREIERLKRSGWNRIQGW